jgi:DoxX-like family
MNLARNNRLLWIIQGLLAALFLFAGGFKLIAPAEQMTMPQGPQLPIAFLRFIGAMEVLGACGLILPRLTGIKPQLTPLAASGLVIIMIGATVISAATMGVATAVLPCVAGILAAFIAYARRQPTHAAAIATT